MTKEEAFVNELIGYIFANPYDDYMTMECLCRKLHKHGLIERKDGEWTCNFIEQADTPQTEQWHYDEKDNTWYPYQHKSCSTCKHALGNWDEESNNCGRCCGADRRFYEPIEDEQTERSSDD